MAKAAKRALRKAAETGITADLAIVGGGLIGMALARAAAVAGLEAVVLDRQDPARFAEDAFDGRVTSIAQGTAIMLGAIGAWQHLEGRNEAILEIRVADDRAPLYLHFDHREVGDRPFGYMVENRHLRAALARAVGESPAARLLAPVEIAGMERDARGVRLRLADGREVRAPLLVAADGRTSTLREAAGIRSLAWRYPQEAIVATLRHPEPHYGVAKEHFLPGGPFALLPMTERRSSMVWTERAAIAEAMMALDEGEFEAEIRGRAGDHLGEVSVTGPRWRHPLGLSNAERYIDRRLVLVGDAAHAMHPLAGQGLNLGYRDVAWLVEILGRRARLGLDLGAAEGLEAYQRRRRADALAMLVMTDGLNRLFSNDIAPLRLARALGLGAVERVGPLKRYFERRASATAGDLPALMRAG